MTNSARDGPNREAQRGRKGRKNMTVRNVLVTSICLRLCKELGLPALLTSTTLSRCREMKETTNNSVKYRYRVTSEVITHRAGPSTHLPAWEVTVTGTRFARVIRISSTVSVSSRRMVVASDLRARRRAAPYSTMVLQIIEAKHSNRLNRNRRL